MRVGVWSDVTYWETGSTSALFAFRVGGAAFPQNIISWTRKKYVFDGWNISAVYHNTIYNEEIESSSYAARVNII